MFVAWVVCPLVLTALAIGWGVLVERACGRKLDGPVLPGIGLAAMIVAAGATTSFDATAELTTPLVAVAGLAGLALGLISGRLRGRPPLWAAGAAVAVFAVYAGPIVLSGEATFAGYIKLDDTATWLALTDRVMEHGRNLDGLAPSTYEATLDFNLGDGYPVGVFLPLGVVTELSGQDPAWLIQPYMAWLAAVLGLCLYGLTTRVVSTTWVRAVIAFVAAQPALLFGYYLWGGIKEIAAAALIALAALLAAERGSAAYSWRGLLPLAIACSALLAVLTAGGVIWLLPILAAALWAGVQDLGWRKLVRPALLFAGTTLALCLPLVSADAFLPPMSSPLDSETAQGNLFMPLNYVQAFGIWPVGDFRETADPPIASYLAATVLLAAAAYGVATARRRSRTLVVYAAASAFGLVLLIAAASPWVEAKAMATASPAFVLLGLCGCVALMKGGRRFEGWVALGVIAVGVLASTFLAYREVNLAPGDQLAELERIGEETAGEGPSLMTEFQSYGARHFLRDSDPQGVSELRRDVIPLLTGGVVRKGRTADTDELRLDGLMPFRTLVLRRSPAQSRPPAPYRLISSGRFYDVWQRDPGTKNQVVAHLPLGVTPGSPHWDARITRTGVPSCESVRELAAEAPPGSELVAAANTEPVPVDLASGSYPASWAPDDSGVLFPKGNGHLAAEVSVPESGDYDIWVAGSVRGRLEAEIDGGVTGTVRHQLNNLGQFIELGGGQLEAGEHDLGLEHTGGSWAHPGSYGPRLPLGPIVLGTSSDQAELVKVPPSRASSLCGKAWDWIEVVRRP